MDFRTLYRLQPAFAVTPDGPAGAGFAPSKLDVAAFDLLADSAYLIAEDGRIAHANQAACGALGYSYDDITALLAWDVDVLLTPERWRALDGTALFGEGFRTVFRRRDGVSFPVQLRGRVVEIGGAFYVLAVWRDMSESVQIERALADAELSVRAILDNIPDMAWMKDRNSVYIAVNEANALTFRIPKDQWAGLTDYDIVPRELADRYRADDARVIAGRQRVCVEEPLVGADGVDRWIETIKTPVFDAGGEVVGTVGIARDISARKMEETNRQRMQAMLEALVEERTGELRHAKEAAEQANRAKSDFLCTMSHELRTPLNVVIGFAEALLEDYFGSLNVKQKEYLSAIDRSGHHLLRIITDILEYARTDAGRTVLNDTVVTIDDLFDISLGLVATGTRRLTRCFPDALPALRVDELRVRQILVNLLGNAVKFSPVGSPLEIGAEVRGDGGVTLWVTDHGIGIAPEEIPRVFEMFTQIGTSMTRQFEGTGIGLPLAAKLAELHGGHLAIDSVPGAWTTVRLHLPPERSVMAGVRP